MSFNAPSDGHYILRSEELAVIVIPAEGGRIASLRSLRSGLEFLTQPRRSGVFRAPGLDAQFRDGPCAGIEECLPTVASCGRGTDGGAAPNHGDFWQMSWTLLRASERQLEMQADGFSRPLRFRKTLTASRNSLHVAYSIKNVGTTAQSFLYACHPLFAVASGDRIVLPAEVGTLRLDYSRGHRLGANGDMLRWPMAKPGVSLDTVLSKSAGTADMLYTERLKEGTCRIQRSSTGQTVDVIFPVEVLPYLGIWLCYGGWPDDALNGQQYAVALEPTTAPFNSLAEAQRAGAAIVLDADTTYAFDITFSVDSPSQV